MSHFKATYFLLQRTSERPAFITKQFTFQKSSGYSGTVQCDEREIAAGTHTMDGTGHQLLTSAGFAKNQDSCIGRGNHFNLLLNTAQGRAAAHNLYEGFIWFGCLFINTFAPVPFS